MKSSTLTRAVVTLPPNQDEELTHFEAAHPDHPAVAFAASNLGYEHPKLLKKKAEMQRIKSDCAKPLAQVLHIAGIKPFTDESVAQYKAEKTKCIRLTHTELSEGCTAFLHLFGIVIHMIGFGMIGATFIKHSGASLCMLPIAALIVGCTLHSWGLIPDNLSKKRPIGSMLSLLFSIMCGGYICELLVHLCGPPSKVWKSKSLTGYVGEVPGFALETAQEVKMRCAEAIFHIEELVENKRVIDPFLVAELGDERYYLEVWDEPSFDQKRIA
jgi:hypothetical protein